LRVAGPTHAGAMSFLRRPEISDGIEIVNAPQNLSGDLYHVLLRAPWWAALSFIAALVLAIDGAFAFVYLWTGGVANARPGSLKDAFFFSVQTLGTIGYGAMYPVGLGAHLAVTAESIARAGGRGARHRAGLRQVLHPARAHRVLAQPRVQPHGRRPTLALRVANQRGNYVAEAQVSVTLVRLEKTKEGVSYYRLYQLPLLRDRSPALGRSWTILHKVDREEPALRRDAADSAGAGHGVIVSLSGLDGTSSQTLHRAAPLSRDRTAIRHAAGRHHERAAGWRLADGLRPHARADADRAYAGVPLASAGMSPLSRRRGGCRRRCGKLSDKGLFAAVSGGCPAGR